MMIMVMVVLMELLLQPVTHLPSRMRPGNVYEVVGGNLNHITPTGGGYGGGPMQMAHMAPTYASICALITLGTEAALASINRQV